MCVNDIRVFNPFACSYSHSMLSQCYVVNEQEKRCAYDKRICEFKRACFPLVFLASGGMGPSATTVYSKLASLLISGISLIAIACFGYVADCVSVC